jgi:hypothetical protein
MQNHKFDVMCPSVLFMEPAPGRLENVVRRRFMPQTHWNALRDPQIPPDAKTQVRRNVSLHTFYIIRTGPT